MTSLDLRTSIAPSGVVGLDRLLRGGLRRTGLHVVLGRPVRVTTLLLTHPRREGACACCPCEGCVTGAAIALRRAGVVTDSRGRIARLDVPALEAAACECRAMTRAHAAWTMGEMAPDE